MTRQGRAPLDRTKKSFVTKPFNYDGRKFNRGDEFPAKELGCDERMFDRLWRQRYLECAATAEASPAKVTVPPSRGKPRRGESLGDPEE